MQTGWVNEASQYSWYLSIPGALVFSQQFIALCSTRSIFLEHARAIQVVFYCWAEVADGMNKRLRNEPRRADDGLCQFGGYYSPGY